MKAGAVKLILSGVAEITGTAESVTVNDTGSVALPPRLWVTKIEP